jgi:hypothetical protein
MEVERMRTEVANVCFKALYRHVSAVTGENHGNIQSGWGLKWNPEHSVYESVMPTMCLQSTVIFTVSVNVCSDSCRCFNL